MDKVSRGQKAEVRGQKMWGRFSTCHRIQGRLKQCLQAAPPFISQLRSRSYDAWSEDEFFVQRLH
jgi:hypothetical protein